MKYSKLHLLVAEDHQYFKESLVSFLKEVSFVAVVKDANDGLEALKTLTSFSPHVIVMDINMPNIDGIEAARQIKEKNADVKIILYSMYDREMFNAKTLDAADRFIPKDKLFEELVQTIEEIYV